MAVIEEALRTVGTADSTLTGLIGTRLYPMVIPRGAALPAVAYQRISTNRESAMAQTAGAGLPWARFQFSCYDSTYSGAKAVANALKAAYNEYGAVVSGVTIEAIHVDNESDIYSELLDKDESSYGILVDLIVWYLE